MAKGKSANKWGSWAFLIGVILALIFGLFLKGLNPAIVYLLVGLGIIVGLLNITEEESTPFLMSGTALVIVAKFGGEAVSTISVVSGVMQALLVLFVPATIVVAIKNVFSLAKN